MAVELSLELMTLAELQTEFVSLADQLLRIDNRRREALRLINKKKAQALAKSKIASMTPDERAALKSALEGA